MQKTFRLLLAVAAVALVTACGGGGSPAPVAQVAKTDTALPASPTVTAAVLNTAFAFPAGVSSFGTTATTTVAFTGTSTTPAFSISSGGKTATGTTTFGSCIFTITSSTFLPPSPLAVGNVVTVEPCYLDLETQGQAANSVSQTRDMSLWLGSTESTETPISVSLSPAGQITINGQSGGTITLAPVTGGSGG